MKIFKKDKLMDISIIGILTIAAVIIGIKLYQSTIIEKQNDQITTTIENDVSLNNLEVEDTKDIEKIEIVTEEKELNIEISNIENNRLSTISDETEEGKTIVIINEEKPVIPETPTIENEEELTDNTKKPEYEEVLVVEENEEVENNVIQVEPVVKNKKDVPEGINTTLVPDSENPFLDLKPPTVLESGIQGETDATEYYEDGRVPGEGDKF